jgi:hypothetical protein
MAKFQALQVAARNAQSRYRKNLHLPKMRGVASRGAGVTLSITSKPRFNNSPRIARSAFAAATNARAASRILASALR